MNRIIRNVLFSAILSICVWNFTGCASAPTRPRIESSVFQKPIDEVQKAAIDALTVTGFDVNKSEPNYVEGYRPRKVGLFAGSGGETVGIWLEQLDASRTRVWIDTARSFVGIAVQKSWDSEILVEMEKSLGEMRR